MALTWALMEVEMLHDFRGASELFAGPFGWSGVGDVGDDGGAVVGIDDDDFAVLVPVFDVWL